MYGFLFDQTYINLIILGFFLFLIMFLWRKITIIEGNYFILEKRVDMFKKTEREHLISKNIEKADIVMNEIFKDSINKTFIGIVLFITNAPMIHLNITQPR